MTKSTFDASSQLEELSIPDDDPIFGFATDSWLDPPAFDPKPAETSRERFARISSETDYRNATNRTYWHRYFTLGRYVVDGHTFDRILSNPDPKKAHCLIWYQYMYHIDRKIDVPAKLEAWATLQSMAYLAKHEPGLLLLNTLTTPWKVLLKELSIPESNDWKTVEGRSKTKKSKSKKTHTNSPPGSPIQTITEETETDLDTPMADDSPTDNPEPPKHVTDNSSEESKTGLDTPMSVTDSAPNHSESLQQKADNVSKASSGGASSAAPSVLIPTLNVPMNDGTNRITLRWKTSIDTTKLNDKSSILASEIHALLKGLFTDEDGHLYKWGESGVDKFKAISSMTPAEVRSYICPSVTISPKNSMIVIPIRFGFSHATPALWRNKASTKEVLERNKVSVSISNSTSSSGNLSIAGYILLKAPMTTHRIRYLQALRGKLPDTTPPFDILLHRRTPADQQINHLVVQCGENHVHALSQILLTALTGNGSPIYIPRFAFADMTREKVIKLFETHDQYIKALKFIPLYPRLTNLDTLRIEHLEDGKTVKRSTREWASSIKLADGTDAKCDVVNGGLDQKAYLLFPGKHEEAVKKAWDEYKQRVFPFNEREARYRENIGPPLTIHINPKLVANLSFMDELPSSEFWEPASSAAQGATTSEAESSSEESSLNSAASNQSAKQSSVQDGNRQEGVKSIPSSAGSSVVGSTTSGMSNSTAKFHALESLFKTQQQESEKRDKHASDRLKQMERQFSRVSDIDKKLDTVQHEVSDQLKSLEDRLLARFQPQSDSAIKSLEQQMASLMSVVQQNLAPKGMDETQFSTPRRRKKARSSRKGIPLVTRTSTHGTPPQAIQSPNQTPTKPNAPNAKHLDGLKTDLESRYNEKTSLGGGDKT
jgi:hypothetical protein